MRFKVLRKQPNSRMCFVCGLENKFGLKSRFYELEDGRLMAVFKPADEHQGYPGRLHGGLAATILDETIGRAVMLTQPGNIWGVTVDFSMKLRKPVPIDGEVTVLAGIVSENKRFFVGEGEIVLADGRVAVTGTGKYLKMDINKISDSDFAGESWEVVSLADDPAYVDLP